MALCACIGPADSPADSLGGGAHYRHNACPHLSMCPGLLKPHCKFSERDGHCVNCVVSESNKVDVSGSSRNVYMSRASRSISFLHSTSENGMGFEIVAFRS
jgi:hypothetical protein